MICDLTALARVTVTLLVLKWWI